MVPLLTGRTPCTASFSRNVMTEIRLSEKSYVRKASLWNQMEGVRKALRTLRSLARHCRTMWSVVSLCDTTFILPFTSFPCRWSCFGVLLWSQVYGRENVRSPHVATRGRQRVFSPLPLSTLAGSVTIAHGGTRRATGLLSPSPATWRRENGGAGGVPRPSGADGV